MVRSIDDLKEKFQSEDVPTAQDFADFMDSYVHKDNASDGGALVNIASRGEAESGTNNVNVMTPLRVSQSIAALTRLSRLSNLRQDVIDLISDYVDGDTGGGTPPGLPACPRQLTITTFAKATGNDYNVQFDAEGVTSIQWKVYDSVNTEVLAGMSPAPLAANTFTIRLQLPSGDYRIVFSPTNCSSADASLRTKTFTVASTTTSFAINDVTIERFPAKLTATIVMLNPNNTTLEYSIDNLTWQSSLVFDNLTETNKFYAREVATPANKVEFTKQESLNTDWLENEVRDYEVVSPTMLNQVDLTFVPNFEIPKRNGKYVIENILKGPNWRNQATAANFFMKGFTHIDELLLNLGTERQDVPYNNSFVSTMPLERIISVGGGGNYPQLELGVDSDAAEMNSINYNNYSDVGNDYKFNTPQKFKGGDSIYKGAFIGFDLENGSFNLNLYDFVNRIVALHQQLLDASSADTEVSLMYQSLPLQLVGFGVDRSHYNGTADATWTTPCSMTGNAQANNFPASLVGKSLKTLSPRMRCKFEYYLFLEAILPEGTRLLNKQNTNLTDWGGNDISILTHFSVGNPSYFHAFAHCAAGLGCQRPHLNGKSLMLQANHFNIAGNGYFYEDLQLPNQPQTTIIKQAYDGLGRYAAPNYIVQGQIFIAIFSGAIYYQWEANGLITEEPRSTGEQINPHPSPSYRDYRGVGAQAVAFRRLAAVKAKVGNVNVSIADLLDGNQIYECEKVQVDYLNVSNFSGTRQVNPLDWIEFKLTPVMTIVNEVKGFIAIWACQAYGVEQSQLDVSYTKNGFNFKKRIQVPAGQNKLYIFSLTSS
jgi:hypothetical protein